MRRLIFQGIDVGQIPEPGDCALVSNQSVFSQEKNRDSVKFCGNFSRNASSLPTPREFSNSRNSFQCLLRPMVKQLHQNPQTFVPGESRIEIAVRFFGFGKAAEFLYLFSTIRI